MEYCNVCALAPLPWSWVNARIDLISDDPSPFCVLRMPRSAAPSTPGLCRAGYIPLIQPVLPKVVHDAELAQSLARRGSSVQGPALGGLHLSPLQRKSLRSFRGQGEQTPGDSLTAGTTGAKGAWQSFAFLSLLSNTPRYVFTCWDDA